MHISIIACVQIKFFIIGLQLTRCMYAQVCNVTSLWDQPALMPEYWRQSEFYVCFSEDLRRGNLFLWRGGVS